jgi:hypothetical protein
MPRPNRIVSVQATEGHGVRLEFADGTSKDVDLGPFLRGPVFDGIRSDRRLFEQVSVDACAGTIVWPNGADVDPDVLYDETLRPAWADDQRPAQLTQSDGR